jgi:hypothetical protein
MTVLSAGDLSIEIDYGAGNPPGTLQRFDNEDWEDYQSEGEVITSETLDIKGLPPGKYRVVETG